MTTDSPPATSGPSGAASVTAPAGSSALSSVVVSVASSTVAYVYGVSGSTPRLLTTTDAGEHFHEVTAPRAGSSTGAVVTLSQMVFPTATAGYALLGAWSSEPAVLLSTTDGGSSWHRLRLPSAAGEVARVGGHGSRVYAAAVRCSAPTHCDQAQIWTAASGSFDFSPMTARLPAVEASGGVGLAAWGSSLWVMLGMGSTTDPVILRSSDAGASFTTRPGPAAVNCEPVATSAQVIWTSCSTGMLMAFQRTRLDEAAYGLPVIGAGTGNTFLDPVSDDVAYFGTALGQKAGLFVTHDGGHRFTKVSAGPPGYASAGSTYVVSFLTPDVGLAAADDAGLFRTIDGGVTWRAVNLPSAS